MITGKYGPFKKSPKLSELHPVMYTFHGPSIFGIPKIDYLWFMDTLLLLLRITMHFSTLHTTYYMYFYMLTQHTAMFMSQFIYYLLSDAVTVIALNTSGGGQTSK